MDASSLISSAIPTNKAQLLGFLPSQTYNVHLSSQILDCLEDLNNSSRLPKK